MRSRCATAGTRRSGPAPRSPLSAGQGALKITGAENDVKLIGPLTSARFVQAAAGEQGYVNIESAKKFKVRALHVPRTA